MHTDDPYLVWMASQLWEGYGTDRRLAGALARHARILWVDSPVSLATPARTRLETARTVRPVLSAVGDRVTRLTPVALPGMTRPGVRCRAFAARHSWSRRADALAALIGLTA